MNFVKIYKFFVVIFLVYFRPEKFIHTKGIEINSNDLAQLQIQLIFSTLDNLDNLTASKEKLC